MIGTAGCACSKWMSLDRLQQISRVHCRSSAEAAQLEPPYALHVRGGMCIAGPNGAVALNVHLEHGNLPAPNFAGQQSCLSLGATTISLLCGKMVYSTKTPRRWPTFPPVIKKGYTGLVSHRKGEALSPVAARLVSVTECCRGLGACAVACLYCNDPNSRTGNPSLSPEEICI